MKRSLHLSAAQMAMLSALGGFFMAISFLIPGLMYARFHHSSFTVRGLILLPPFLIGTTLLYLAGNRLKRGIKDGRWPLADVETLRRNTTSTLWNALHYSVWIISLIFLLIPLLFDSQHRLFQIGYAAMMVSNTMVLIKSTAGKTTPDVQPPPEWNPAPLSSEHWGQP